jgi:hypothetical protein
MPYHMRSSVLADALVRVTVMLVLAPGLALAQSAPVDPWAPPPEPVPVEPVPAEPVEPVPVEPVIEPIPAPVEPAPDEVAPPDPDFIAADTLPATEPLLVVAADEPRWPRSLPARPLLEPDGTFGVGLGGALSIYDEPVASAKAGNVSLSLSRVFGRTELGISGSFVVFSTKSGPESDELAFPTVTGLGASIRRLVGDDLTFGGGGAARYVGSEYQGWSLGLGLLKKVRFSKRAALLLNGGLEYERAVWNDRDTQRLRDYDRIGLFTMVAAEASISERASVYASISVAQNIIVDDSAFDDDNYRRYGSRLALVLAQNDNADLWINLNVFSSGNTTSKSVSVLLDLRRLP